MSGKNCSRLPNFLIVGPQKTGSTALASFLSYHPLLVVNDNNPVTFEEVQFFSDDNNYQKGIEWLVRLLIIEYCHICTCVVSTKFNMFLMMSCVYQ